MSNIINLSKLQNIGEELLNHYLFVACDNELYNMMQGEPYLITHSELSNLIYFAYGMTLSINETKIVYNHMINKIK